LKNISRAKSPKTRIFTDYFQILFKQRFWHEPDDALESVQCSIRQVTTAIVASLWIMQIQFVQAI